MYQMLYSGDNERVDEPRGIGIALSRDLVNWEKFPGNPVFLPGKPGSWDSEAIWCPWIVRRNHEYWMYYCGSRTTYSEGLTPQTGVAIIG
jgi:beta-xylosidase